MSSKNLNIVLLVIFSSITQISCDTSALYDVYGTQEATKRVLFPIPGDFDSTVLGPLAWGAALAVIVVTGISLCSCYSQGNISSKRKDVEEDEEEVKVVETTTSKNGTTKETVRGKKNIKMDKKTALDIVSAIGNKEAEYES